ncbi:MAG: cyclic nucleotide-binding domain-containing protein, partial [Halieaceae bacterium]
MLANAELAQDFALLNQQFKELVDGLVDVVDIPPVRVEVSATPAGNFRGFDAGKFYVVDSGSVTARYQGRAIFILEEGDMLLPDIAGTSDLDMAVLYGSEAGASLVSYPALEFMQRIFNEPQGVKIWTRMLITYSGLMLRLTAA